MIRLGLRLTLAGGREAAARLAVIVVAVAVGAALLFVTVAGTHAVDAQNQRYAWLETGFAPDSLAESETRAGVGADAPDAGDVDPVWWRLGLDNYDGDDIGRIDVAATGPDAPVPPGMDALPGPGEYVASPALAGLMGSVPASQLADRYPGRLVDVMDRAALASPDTLLVVVGRRVGDLDDDPDARRITAISSTAPDACGNSCGLGFGIDAQGTTLVLGVVAAALLFPVLVFIGSATRLSAARREQRFAAMRLVGATPRQVDVLSTVESTAASALGVVGGLGLFALLRASIARIPFTGARFYVSDLALGPGQVLVIAVGVPLAAAVAARIALRRAQSSPLATGRRSERQRPRVTRLVPLFAGLGELAWFAVNGRPGSIGGQLGAYLSGVLLTMTGLVVAGPWLTLHGSRLLARYSRRPVGLIAGRRLSDDPQAGFRAVSGLVLALFIGSGTIGTIASVRAASSPPQVGSTLVVELDRTTSQRGIAATAWPAELVDRLDAVPGVEGATVVHARFLPDAGEDDLTPFFEEPRLVTCAQLDRTPSLGRCEPGAATAVIQPEFTGPMIEGAPRMDDLTWPAGDLTPDQVEDLPVVGVAVGNDGSTAAVEAARTVLETSLPDGIRAPATIGELNQHGLRQLVQYQQLADVVIGANLAIAGCSLAVSVVAGLNDRRRPFSLLRLTGTPVTMLRRVVAVEAVVPLLATAAIAAGVGFLTAGLFIRAQMDRSLAAPGATYFLVVAIGLAGSLAVIASTLPLLDRLTGPEAARND